MVKALDRKLVRDLLRMRGQAITIALVMGVGIAQLFAFVTMYQSLEASRDVYCAQSRFADLFDHLDRAPRAVLSRLAEIPGVAQVEGRVVQDAPLVIPGSRAPVLGHFVGLSDHPDRRLNRLQIVEGRDVAPGHGGEVVVSAFFADARKLHAGDFLTAVLGGHLVRLSIVGVGVSPEFLYVANPRTGFIDSENYGVLWMDGTAVATAFGLGGAFDDVAASFAAAAHPQDAVSAFDRLLAPWGGTGAVLRADQPSAKVLDLKIDQYRKMVKVVPAIFLGVAAFILNLVLSRLVATQRDQIATLKALGYDTAALARHYLLLAAAIGVLGAALGLGLGSVEARDAIRILGKYFNLPLLVYRFNWAAAGAGIAASVAAGLLGALAPVRRTVRLPAAEAMQPEAPESFAPTVIERLRIDRLFGVAGRMVLRDVERHPFRLTLSAVAVAFATAILLVGSTMVDSLDRALTVQFTQVEGEDLAVAFDRPRSAGALADLDHVPGVVRAEAQRVVPARLRSGWRERTLSIVGVPRNATLRRFRDVEGRRLAVPAGGLVLSRPLGKMLDVRPGDALDVRVLEGAQPRLRLPVASFVDDMTGLSAYADLDDLDHWLGGARAVSGALLAVDRSRFPDIQRRLMRLPAVAGFSRPDLDRQQFESQESNALRALGVMLAIFAAIIAVGLVFNNARIALAVRARDLATLRILGFSRGEVATVLLGEQALQLVLGVALGLPLGWAMGAAMLASIPPDLFRVPAWLSPGSLIEAALVVLLSGFACALYVRREADRLDLVAVLKARD